MNLHIFDSHAHYDDEVFNEDREAVIKDIQENGVVGVLNCGSSFQGAKDSLELAQKYEFFYAAVGVHPEYADMVSDNILEELELMAKDNKVKAIGEIGLDYYWDTNPQKEIQIQAFKKQMKLADRLGLPVVIHDRDAHLDTINVMKEFENVKGVVHCFSGSVEFARECIKLGYYIGFTGVVTFKNAKKILEVAKDVPLDRMLVETDCPYMAPTPYRGKRNQSSYINYILEKLAEEKEIPVEKLNNQIIENTRTLFNIKH